MHFYSAFNIRRGHVNRGACPSKEYVLRLLQYSFLSKSVVDQVLLTHSLLSFLLIKPARCTWRDAASPLVWLALSLFHHYPPSPHLALPFLLGTSGKFYIVQKPFPFPSWVTGTQRKQISHDDDDDDVSSVTLNSWDTYLVGMCCCLHHVCPMIATETTCEVADVCFVVVTLPKHPSRNWRKHSQYTSFPPKHYLFFFLQAQQIHFFSLLRLCQQTRSFHFFFLSKDVNWFFCTSSYFASSLPAAFLTRVELEILFDIYYRYLLSLCGLFFFWRFLVLFSFLHLPKTTIFWIERFYRGFRVRNRKRHHKEEVKR